MGEGARIFLVAGCCEGEHVEQERGEVRGGLYRGQQHRNIASD